MTAPDAERLALFRAGEAFFLDTLARLPDGALHEPCALDGWSRRHLVSHFARNADAIGRLLTWAKTGDPTPMYRSAEERVAGIDDGATRSADVVRADAITASARLVAAVAMMPPAAWDATVRTGRGRRLDAGDIPWLRLRESWIHTLDLAAGRTPDDLPAALVDPLLDEVATDLGGRGNPGPALVLVEAAGGRGRTWRVDPTDPGPEVEVEGTAPELLGWLIGRTDGAALRASTPDGRPPTPPPWF